MENCIKQNNGIDIYVEYFEEADEITQFDAPQAKSIGNIILVFLVKYFCDVEVCTEILSK